MNHCDNCSPWREVTLKVWAEGTTANMLEKIADGQVCATAKGYRESRPQPIFVNSWFGPPELIEPIDKRITVTMDLTLIGEYTNE